MFVDLEDIRKRYHIRNFLEQQGEVLEHLLNEGGKSNILYMATAARGKTLPPLIATLENRRKNPRKMTLWFVPTIALAHDLMKRIEKNGNYGKLIPGVERLKYMCFTGETVEDKKRKKVSIAKNGNPDFLILSPESLKDPAFLAWLISGGEHIGLIVLDEAHLCDEWGITFRRAYFIISWLINTLREQNKLFKVIALSASLPQEKENVVKQFLMFREEDTFSSRPNTLRIGPKIICYSHKNKSEKGRLLLKLLRKNVKRKQSGIEKRGVLFSPYKSEGYKGMKLEWSVKNIKNEIIPKLGLRNGECEVYTGGTKPDERERILGDLHKNNGKIRCLLATSAFGFGVDVDKLNFSIHVQVPEDIDRFYQEISRCSRKPMYGIANIFYNSHEVAVQTKRCMRTLKFQTVRDYLNYLGIKNIRKGNKTLAIKRVLRKSDKTFKNQKKAQMSADSYFHHAFEAIMFLFRQGIIQLKPLGEKHFPKKLSMLRKAFENGRSSGYGKVSYKKFKVLLPSVKLPIRILSNISWPRVEQLVLADKRSRGKRTEIFRKMGRNSSCHWKLIADHYGVPLQNKKGKIVETCNYCNVCRTT